MKKIIFLLLCMAATQLVWSQKDSIVTKRDRKKDVLLETSMGNIWIRLSDSTPLHRDNFIKLVKTNYYPGIL